MKEEEENELPLHHHKRRVTNKILTKPTAYVILVLLSYVLGFLSAQSSSNSPKPSNPILPPQTITATATATDSQLDHFRVTTKCALPVPSKLIRQTILDRLFNGTSPYDDFPPAHAKPLLRPKRIKGWGSTGAVFENLVRKVNPRTIIEVGTFLGASAIHMAELTRSLGLKTQILCVDDFRGWPGFRDRFRDIAMVNGDVMLLYQFMQNAIQVNVSDVVMPVPFSTGSTLIKLCEWGVFGDLIEIDAGHDFNSAWSDITRAFRILRPGGVIFGHDYFTAADNRGVRRAVDLFARVHGLRVQVDGQHWVIESA